MTNEEAIKRLEGVAEYFDAHIQAMGGDAIRLGISAIRAQQTKLDRNRWEGCNVCRLWRLGAIKRARCMQFCAICGRPLTDEAWAELERRISVGTDDK